ncbi:MAG: hypothetical protein WC852_02710 [Candidatus Nanoarchaeia archaeon]|jgi:hypothetical protein
MTYKETILDKTGFAALKLYNFMFSEAKINPELSTLEKAALTVGIKADKWTGGLIGAIERLM